MREGKAIDPGVSVQTTGPAVQSREEGAYAAGSVPANAPFAEDPRAVSVGLSRSLPAPEPFHRSLLWALTCLLVLSPLGAHGASAREHAPWKA